MSEPLEGAGSDSRRLSYRPAVGDGLTHLPGQGLGESRVGLAAPRAGSQVTYRRDEAEKIFQRVLIGDAGACHDSLRP